MATRLYFHAASNALSGTFPTGEQSSTAANYTATGANTLRTMNTTAGSSQTSITGTTLANVSLQLGFHGFFCSPPFDVNQTVGTNGQTITLNIANAESSLSANLWADLRFNIYIWRPSTGAIVGSIQDQGTLTGDAEPGAFNSERVNQGTRTGSTPVAALAGDVLICEVWERHTQATSIAYTSTFYFDGTTTNTTTNAVVTNHASFLDFSTDTLTFAGTPVSASLNAAFGAITLSADALVIDPGLWDSAVWDADVWDGPILEATLNSTFAGITLAAAADVVVGAALNSTFAGITLAAAADAAVGATLNSTFAGIGFISQAVAGSEASFNNTFAGLSLAATMETVFEGAGSLTMDDIGLAASLDMGSLAVECTFNNAMGGLGLAGALATVATASLNSTFDGMALTAAASLDLNFLATFNSTFQGISLSCEVFIVVPPFIGVSNMNDSLNRWLTNRGFTGSLQDKQHQALRTVVVGAAATDSLNDLWVKYGLQEGYGVEIEEIQRNWAIAQGATSTLTWNDAMGSLPA